MPQIYIPWLKKTKKNLVNHTSKTEFYGWRLVFWGTAILFVSSGVGFYCQSVILDPLRNYHGWSKGTISSALSFYFFIMGLSGTVVGRIIDKYGSRPVLIIGSVIMGLALLGMSLIQDIWQLYIVYFIMAVGFTCTSLLPTTTLITNWFIRKRGFAMSLTMTGLSVGGIFIVPFATYLIAGWGIRLTLPVLGVLFWIIIIPIAIFFIRQHPSDLDQFPDGDSAENARYDKPVGSLSQASQTRIWTRVQAMRTMAFWSIVIAFLLGLGGQITFMMHQVSFLGQYLGPIKAAYAVSITAAASIIGRFIMGLVVDRYDKRYMTILCFMLQGSSLIALANTHHNIALYFGTFIFGLTMGSILMMQPLIVGECFGMVSFGTISGLAGLFGTSGSAFGPMIAGFIYDATHSYDLAFTIFATASVLASIIIYFAKPPDPDRLPIHAP
ncbi:MFS transporter [Thermodesulfobacteriota bacterium]